MTIRKQVIAIDPGQSVGWAIGEFVNVEGGKWQFNPLRKGVTPLKDFAMKMQEVFANYDVVVYEHWRLYPDKAKALIGDSMLTSQLIGMLRLMSWNNPQVEFVSLAPGTKFDAAKIVPKWYKKWYSQSTEEHDKDAAELLYYYFHKEFA